MFLGFGLEFLVWFWCLFGLLFFVEFGAFLEGFGLGLVRTWVRVLFACGAKAATNAMFDSFRTNRTGHP